MIPNQDQEQENPFIRYMVGPTRSPNRDEPFHMLMRKYGVAATLLLGLAVGVPALGFIVAPILRGESWGSPADVGTIGFPCAWALTWALLYGYAVRKKEIPDWLIDPVMFLQETLVLLFDLSAVGLLPAGITLMANGCNAILMQAPHWRLHVAFCTVMVLFEFYVPIAEDLGWPTGTLPGRRKLRWTDLLFVRACFAGPVMGLVVSALLMQMNEQRRQVATADSAVRAATVLAEFLGRYDTESAACSLRAGKIVQCTESETPKNSRYKMSTINTAKKTEEEGRREDNQDSDPVSTFDVEPGFTLHPQLYVAFQQLIANLDAYRPHLPNWLLAGPGTDEDSDPEDIQSRSGTAKLSASTHSQQLERNGCVPLRGASLNDKTFQQRSREASICSAASNRSAKSPVESVGRTPQMETQILRPRSVAAVAVEYWHVAATDSAEDQQLAVTALADAVHRIANETRGAVHSFTFGEALVSFGAAARVPNPEAAAARFMLALRDAVAVAAAADASRVDGTGPEHLARIRFCAAAATASGLSHQAGTRQRVLACDAPLRWRLRGLLKYAAEVSGSGSGCAVDAPVAERARADCQLVVDQRTMRQASNAAFSAAGIVSIAVGPRERAGGPSSPPPPGAAHPASGSAPVLVAAFDLMDWRRDAGDGEWLYAMERTPADDLIDAQEKVAALQSATPQVSPASTIPALLVMIGESFAKVGSVEGGAELIRRPLAARWVTAITSKDTAVSFTC